MRTQAASGLAIVVGAMVPAAASAQTLESAITPAIPWTSSWMADSVPAAAQRYPMGFQLSESQRRGMRWGAQIGIFAGVGVVLLVALPEDDDDCPEFECVGKAAALPFYLAAGMLGGMVAGGAVGLAIGTIVDDEGESQASLGLSVTLRVP